MLLMLRTNRDIRRLFIAQVISYAGDWFAYVAFVGLVQDWWTVPEAGHGLLLAPVAVWLAWKAGIRPGAEPHRIAGLAILIVAVLIRCAAGLAAEIFTTRVSILIAIAGLTVHRFGTRQLLHWWLPFTLAGRSIPLPESVTQALALPLQSLTSRARC